MKFRAIIYSTGTLLLVLPSVWGEIKVTPVANVSLSGGQYWIKGAKPDSMSLNMDVFVSPVLNFSPTSALLPIYTGTYSGTKDVRELIGGGTLTRELQDHSISLKFIQKLPGDIKLKERTGYKIEYLKETVDETWGHGLFDFQKMIGGVEVEKDWGGWSGRIGLDYYTMHYPNYQSLVSQSAFNNAFTSAADTTTYKEISSQAGTNVLDYRTYSLFMEATKIYSDKVTGTLRNDISFKSFPDQKVIKNTGEFSSDSRSDIVDSFSAGVKLASPRAVFGLSDGIQYNKSNQNSYDAGNSKYIPNYYDYIQNSVTPNITFYLGDMEIPDSLSLYWDIAYRQYTQRLAQDTSGAYKDGKIYQTTNTFGLSFSHPITKLLSASFSMNYRDSSSNMQYEKNYMYNYYTFNYFIGVNWQL